MGLLEAGIVGRFVCYDLASETIEMARQDASERGLGDRIAFRCEDGLSASLPSSADLVHWDNSLHHMSDVAYAIRRSREILRPGGLLFLNEYVGANRLQWTDANLELASRMRRILPKRFLRDRLDPNRYLDWQISRRPVEDVIAEDPSEAIQSEMILDAVQASFPSATIIPTGGAMYHLVFQGIAGNFDESREEDRAFVDSILLADDICRSVPEIGSHYAVAIAIAT